VHVGVLSSQAAHDAARMSNVLAWLLALLLTVWQAQVAHAQDHDQNKNLCGTSDFYNSTSIPYSCTP
jgi:hypothetical protein